MNQKTFQTTVVACLLVLLGLGSATAYYIMIYQPEQQRQAAVKAAEVIDAVKRDSEMNVRRARKAQLDAEFDRDPHAATEKLLKEVDDTIKGR